VTARALHGLDSIHAAALKAPPAVHVHVLVLDGLPRTGLSVKEVAKITGHKENRIRDAIRNGEIKADRTGQAPVIPITQLAEITKWADYTHAT
jgi:hypothetical protein